MAQYERKNLNYVEGLDDDDPIVKNYDRICRILSYAAALAAVLLIRISGLLNSLPPVAGTIILIVILFVAALVADFLLQKFVFGPLALRKTKK
ncbi:MAG: hypothetical protein IKG59_08365 [Firmicutes bacterium]|nr:hypothetical protein [Bacillota bacterium]